jgi:hypothetical protein
VGGGGNQKAGFQPPSLTNLCRVAGPHVEDLATFGAHLQLFGVCVFAQVPKRD